jgi:hypothetical protein
MSEISGGPGYWQASDGLWYPPDQHPDSSPGSQSDGGPTTAAGATTAPGVGGYPARLTFSDDNTVARWRVFAHMFMAIPHMIILYVLGLVSSVIAFVSWFIILFTGKLPEGLHNFQAMYLRYFNRTMGFALLLTEEYPPFEFDTTAQDGSSYPIRSDYDHEADHRNRATVFFRLILLVPAIIVLYIVMLGASVAYFIAWFAVLFTGRMPEGIRGFLIGVGRWGNRVQAYARLLTDQYPPFSLD